MCFRDFVIQNFPFLEDDFDALTDYELFCKMVEYMRKALEDVDSFQTQLTQFKARLDYYENYFNNLDLQEEVDHKLDEMAESGELTDIIAQYLGLAGMITFDSVADMKSAENLVNGSKCATLGYHSVNDGGNALYKVRNITNEDTVDDMFIIGLHNNQLVAELIYNEINLKQVGCYGDGTHDDSDIIENIFENINEKDIIYVPKGKYLCPSDISISIDNIKIYGDDRDISIIDFNNLGSLTFTSNQLKIENVGFTKQKKIEITGYHNTLSSCSINYGTNGLILNNAYINQVLNCYITQNNGVGLVLNEESYETVIDNCVIDNNKLGVLVIGVSTGAIISNSTIEGNRDRTTNQGVGVAISTTANDLKIENCWFENNGTSNDSVDVLSIGLVNDSTISTIIDYVDSLYTYTKRSMSGKISIICCHFVYTQYGIVTSGYLIKYVIENNHFSGILDKYNKAVLYYTNYQNTEEIVASNNQVTNTNDQSITTQMLSGIKGSYIYTNITISNQNIKKYVNGIAYLDNKPLFVYEKHYEDFSDIVNIYQYQSGGSTYNSGRLLNHVTNSYPTTTNTTYLTKTLGSTTAENLDLFNTTDEQESFAVIETLNSTFQCRVGSNVATNITAIYDNVFPIKNEIMFNKRAYAYTADSVIFSLIQFNATEKKESKQCIALKLIGYNYTSYISNS